MATELSTPLLSPLESQAERRRAQLVTVTAHLVVTEGVDSVSHATVAAAAGCARTLVYRYFPTREDLLAAIPEAYARVYSSRIAPDEAASSILAAAKARRGQTPTPTQRLAERIWAPEDWNQAALELRLALLVIVRDRDVARDLQDGGRIEPLTNSELTAPLRELGLSDIEIVIVRDAMLAGYSRAVEAALAGTITREEAIELTCRVNLAALRMFLR
jgi:AcrR family transcriptional regulator